MRIKKLLPMMLLASAPFTAMAQGQAGIKAENLDKSVRPADDFFTLPQVMAETQSTPRCFLTLRIFRPATGEQQQAYQHNPH